MKYITVLLFILFTFSSCYQSKLTIVKGNRTKVFNKRARLTFFITDINSNGDSIESSFKGFIISATSDSIKLRPIQMRQTSFFKDKRILKTDTTYTKDTITYTSINIKSIDKIEKERRGLTMVCNGISIVALAVFIPGIISAPFSEKSDWPGYGQILGLSLATCVAVTTADVTMGYRSFNTKGKGAWAIQK